GEQLGVHGDGQPGLEPEGVERPDAAGVAAARGQACGREANAVADGVRDVLCGGDPDAVPDPQDRGAVDLSAVFWGFLAADVPASGGAAPRPLVVLSALLLKSGSGCPDPCWPSNDERR